MRTKKSYSRRAPQRTCVACRRIGDKRTLIRLVRLDKNSVEMDPTGRMNGRGAYICPDADCWREAIKKGQLERALKVSLKEENRRALIRYGESLKTRE